MKRLLLAAALVTGLVLVMPAAASAQEVTSCEGVMSGSDNPNLSKSLVSVALKAGTTDTWILTYRVDSAPTTWASASPIRRGKPASRIVRALPGAIAVRFHCRRSSLVGIHAHS